MSYDYKNYITTSAIISEQSVFRGEEEAEKTNPNVDNNSGEIGIKTIDNFVKKIDEETDKKHNKTALSVGIGVTALSLVVTLFNPKVSSKLIKRLKQAQNKTTTKYEKHKNKEKGKLYKWIAKTTDWLSRFISSINNINSVKDTYYKKLSTENKVFSKVLKKPHEWITKVADKLARHTVKRSYKKAGRDIEALEDLLNKYRNNLTPEKQKEFDNLMKQISKQKEFFNETSVNSRMNKQEELMENLNKDIRKKFREYTHGFKNGNRSRHFNNNLSFWAQDMMETQRATISEEGRNAVEILVNGEKGYKGIIEFLSPHIKIEEKNRLNNSLEVMQNKLRNANKNECNKYFDKKRDLILGSAPTDILSTLIFLTIGGVAIAAADNKDDRISRLFTKVGPTVVGVGTNIALTSMLFSGTKGLLFGGLAAAGTSLLGSQLDHLRLRMKNSGKTGMQEDLNVVM